MRKQYLILETTQFNVPPPPPPPPPRPQEAVERAIRNGGGRVEVQAVRNPPPMLDERFFLRETFYVVCYSMHDAEEYVDNELAAHPQLKFVVFESVAFLETVASPTLRKMWDENGQLVETR